MISEQKKTFHGCSTKPASEPIRNENISVNGKCCLEMTFESHIPFKPTFMQPPARDLRS